MRGLAILVSCSLLAGTGLQGQSPAESASRQSTVFRSSASLVAVNVTVTDASSRFVGGLGAGDFAIFEDGVRQDLEFFEASAVPVDLILLLDTSSSMRPRMPVVHEAALGFVKNLRAADRAAVVAFSDGVDVVQPLTADGALLETAIRGTIARGATALHNAIYVSLKQFGRAARDTSDIRRQALAVLSDGDDTSSLIGFDDVLELARKSGVSIYPIALSPETDDSGRRPPSESAYSLRRLAQETGAQAFFPHHIRELAEVYASIARELANQYSLAYSPQNTAADGRFRRIAVRIDSRPELRLRARSGYIAPVAGSTWWEQDR